MKRKINYTDRKFNLIRQYEKGKMNAKSLIGEFENIGENPENPENIEENRRALFLFTETMKAINASRK